MVFLAFWIPASLRYGTGADYFSYVDIFNYNDFSLVEIGWVVLNKGIRFVGLSSPQWVFVFSAFLIYFPICFVLKRKNYFYSILFYLILGYYFRSFNLLRQCVAVSFLFCGVTALEFNKNIRFFLWLALASMFHISALFLLLFFPLKYIKIKRHITPLLITIFMVLISLKFNFLEIALAILEKMDFKYALYHYTMYATKVTALGSGLGVLVKLLPSFLVVFMAPNIIQKYPQKTFLVNLSIVYIWLFFLSAQFLVMGRARDIFAFVPILLTGFAIQMAGKYKKIVVILLVSLNLLLIERDIRDIPKSGYARWMNPYYSIFSDITREEIFGLYGN
jgi:hypothetical protein